MRNADEGKDEAAHIDIALLFHKLRQPLHSLQLLSDLLRQTISDEEKAIIIERLDDIVASFKHLLDVPAGPARGATAGALPQVVENSPGAAHKIRTPDPSLAREAFHPASAVTQVFLIDDDKTLRDNMCDLLKQSGLSVEPFSSAEAFLASTTPQTEGCLIVDQNLSGMSGLELIAKLRETNWALPSIMITGFGDIQLAVAAMKNGAIDFVEKPFAIGALLSAISNIANVRDSGQGLAPEDARRHALMLNLSEREKEILDGIFLGQSSKIIARNLGISHRTVDNHRASILKKTGAKSAMELARKILIGG